LPAHTHPDTGLVFLPEFIMLKNKWAGAADFERDK
jgi:hypothetical protein